MVCDHCKKGRLYREDELTPEWYDYLFFRCSSCEEQRAILVVEMKKREPRLYSQLVRNGVIDSRYKVYSPGRAA